MLFLSECGWEEKTGEEKAQRFLLGFWSGHATDRGEKELITLDLAGNISFPIATQDSFPGFFFSRLFSWSIDAATKNCPRL